MAWIDVESIETPSVSQPCPPVEPDSLALLQYTSGSTSAPKGVALTHRNLMANLGMIYEAFEVDPDRDEWSVNWLPPYHDMGLIGGLLQVMYAGTCFPRPSAASFVQKPIRWLRAIDKYRASVSGGPNFAFDACVERTTKAERSSIDLSSWTLAFTGAEPIQHDSLRRFSREFESCGFDESSFFPCYGLAEATLMVSGGPRQRTPVLESPSPQDPSQRDSTTSQLVSCGRIVNGMDVRIVDPETSVELEPGCVGEILVAGENVSRGYWNQTLANSSTFRQSVIGSEVKFLKTGDLGYLRRGELFVRGGSRN